MGGYLNGLYSKLGSNKQGVSVLVDDKQAREKMAKEVDRYMGTLIPGFSERHDGAIVCLTRLAAAIRQTDLSDCKVEVADLEKERERIASDLCQWCEGRYTVKEIFSEALQEYANLCLRENLIRSVEIAAEKDERIESLSAQVAELQRINGVLETSRQHYAELAAVGAVYKAMMAEAPKALD